MLPQGLGEDELRRAVATLSFPFIEERSVKISPGRLSAERMLMSLVARSLDPDRRARLRSIARQLGLPPEDTEPLVDMVDHAETVHFGAERDRAFAFKLYLEFRIGGGAPHGLPQDTVFFAAKWLPGNRATFSVYRDLPTARDTSSIREVARALDVGAGPFDFLESVLAGAAPTAPDYGFPTMEVVDLGTSRRSIDVNIYGAGTRLAEHGAALHRLAAGFGIPEPDLVAGLRRFGDPVLGHISAGRGRGGEAFATVYFGAMANEAAMP